LGNAYLDFVEKFPEHSSFFDSGLLSPIFGRIIRKEQSDEDLTESEIEFKESANAIETIMTAVITATMEQSGVQEKADPFSVIMALSTLGLAIRDMAIRSSSGGVSGAEAREHLAVLFNIIEQGLKHYDAK
ncbi:MAG: hypothetical protein ACFE7R_06010, partial [Candidatus Hodarchaeota archaeon]